MSGLHTQEVLLGHANARLTVHGRTLLVRRVRFDRRPISHVAKELGVSRQCAHRWVKRFDHGGWAALHDRSSRPRCSPRRTPREVEARVIGERRASRRGPDWIAVETGVPARTVTRILRRHLIPHLSDCDPLTGQVIRASRSTAKRYERTRPGELVHIDVKKIGRIPDGGGWKAHGRGPQPVSRRGAGFDYVHSAVDDYSRAAYSEILPDETGASCAGFLLRAAGYFAQHQVQVSEVITDNHFSYKRSTAFAQAVGQLGAKHRFIKAHCPWQNGKVERFNRTLQVEWAYRRVFTSNTERSQALAPWLDFYNTRRRHTALGGLPPIRRLSPT
jgi:transposase InsO family protein